VFLSLYLLEKMSKSSILNDPKTLLIIETSLEDKYSHMFFPKFSSDLYELHNLAYTRYIKLNEFFNALDSNLAQLLVPQIYNFP
jgi:hypothetical protein